MNIFTECNHVLSLHSVKIHGTQSSVFVMLCEDRLTQQMAPHYCPNYYHKPIKIN